MDKYIEYFSCRDAFYNAILDILSGDSNNDRANQIIDLFDDLPTADVQPVKYGRWENTNTPNQLRCSNCEIIHFIAQYPHGDIKYCPNCGARMIKGGDTE